MQTVLKQLAQKIESFDSQLQSLSHPTTTDQAVREGQTGHDELASEVENNKKYLRSLDVTKVSYYGGAHLEQAINLIKNMHLIAGCTKGTLQTI